MRFAELAIPDPNGLVFGIAPRPVRTRRGLEIGAGHVYAELNFTLPPMEVSRATMPEMTEIYRGIVREALQRALQLRSRGVVLEFETLIEMTREPDLGVELTEAMSAICDDFLRSHGLPSEIRLTPNDLREFERPPRQRSSALLEPMFELFERGARAGGDLLSIESTGGKEVSDDALMACDIRLFVFSQAVLGARDMEMLWSRIVEIARQHRRIAGGDTACGFGNTAMVLAEKRLHPEALRRGGARGDGGAHAGGGGAGRDRTGQGLRLRGSVPEGDHGHPDLDGGQDGGLRAPEPGRQRGRRLRRPLEQRVGAERQAARRHGPDRLPGAARVRHAPHERGAARGSGKRSHAAAAAWSNSDVPPRPAGLRTGAEERDRDLARDRPAARTTSTRRKRGCLKALDPDRARPIRDGRAADANREGSTSGSSKLRDDLESIPPRTKAASSRRCCPTLDAGKVTARGVRPVAPRGRRRRAPQAAIDLRYSSAPWGSGE